VIELTNAPLGLPVGSVRAIIAILVVVGCMLAGWADNRAELFETFKDLTLVIVTFYFTSRMLEKKNE